MIIEALCMFFFGIIQIVIVLLPNSFTLPNWGSSFISIISKALYFFPADVWAVCIGNIVFVNSALLLWAFVEWSYKKLPGVD